MSQCIPIIEAILFAAGDVVPMETLVEITGIERAALRQTIELMEQQYEQQERGIQIREINGGYQLCSKKDYFEYVKKLFEPRQKQELSKSALESLAIVAYKQPITRIGVEKIRGVNSDRAINSLVERGLLEEAGRMDAPGRPILYKTTEEFLRAFGYKTLEDLPKVEEEVSLEE